MDYSFNNDLVLTTKKHQYARFWTQKQAQQAAIKTAHKQHIDFVGTMVIVSGLFKIKNRVVVLVTKKSTYQGQSIINSDNQIDQHVKTIMQKTQHIKFD